MSTSGAVRAAGLIIYRLVEKRIEYLLLQTSYGQHHWTPPKGHVDSGESDFETALRETEEEAGLKAQDLDIDKDFKVELRYQATHHTHGLTDKVVTYWLAKLLSNETEVKLSDEHQDLKWLGLAEACKLSGYQDMQNALKQCDEKIQRG